jgi:hypothetical protein
MNHRCNWEAGGVNSQSRSDCQVGYLLSKIRSYAEGQNRTCGENMAEAFVGAIFHMSFEHLGVSFRSMEPL